MNNFKLEPADALIRVIKGKGPFSVIKRWALGNPYDHVYTYLGNVGIYVTSQTIRILRIPMLFESNGQGCVIQPLSSRYGEEVVVMRLKAEYRQKIPRVLTEAVGLARPGHYYDYLCIVRFILPRLICEKLRLPLLLKYQRNPLMICSEAVLEIFLRSKVPVLPGKIVPLPGDFVELSGILDEVQRGKLSPEWV